MSPVDAVLDRITFEAKPDKLTPIPWPAGLAPTNHGAHAPAEIPQADVLVVTWTAAEGQALADVLTPGHPSSSWRKDTTNWAEFEPQLTSRSPARESKCLGVWAVTTIAGKTVVLYKSDLHLSTDSTSLPVVQLWEQLLRAVQPKLVITTGTAGGIGADTQLGDVAVTNGARFNCQQAFKDEPYAHATYGRGEENPQPAWAPGEHLLRLGSLLEANADRLKPIASRVPVVRLALEKPGVETVDYFGFADTDDSYGIVKDDADALTEEMDDATLPLALQKIWEAYGNPLGHTPWLSIRNASDPQVASSIGDLEAQKKWASGVYAKYGYWTTVGSAIACWAVIADMEGA
jgi:nucleoside phosphorylase